MLAAVATRKFRPALRGGAGALLVRQLGLTEHVDTFAAMRAFTAARNAAKDANAQDEIWLTEHAPVYTLGLAGKPEHVLNPHGIPVVQTDRGGQVTYHGPGQVVAYVLLDMRRRDLKVRELVTRIEDAVIATLAEYGVSGQRRAGMPGVYVNEAKIAALGLKVKNGCTYHGVSLNVAMDLAPFAGINPCGYAGLTSVQLADFAPGATVADAGARLAAQLNLSILQQTADIS
jgi:lipoyl(octanoyl) transferase